MHTHFCGRASALFRRGTSFVACVLAGVIAACTPTTPINMDVPADDPGDGAPTISFSQHVQPVFSARCASCHRAGGVATFSGVSLRLFPGESYASLINGVSVENGDLRYLVPGDAENSLLFLKIASDDPPVGVRMPIGGRLAENDIRVIRRWIEEGALDN